MPDEGSAAAHMEHLSLVYSERHYSIEKVLSQSLNPRTLDLLANTADEYLSADSRILDIGCRDASHLIGMVQRHGAEGAGIDPLAWHLDQAREAVAAAGLEGRIRIAEARMEAMPFAGAAFDFVWCRDTLALIDDLDAGFAEAVRVLRPGGHMLVYTMYATERLEPREAAMLNEGLGNLSANMQEARMEAVFAHAGLEVMRKEVIGTEWREYEEEREKPVSNDLLMLARLRRNRDAVVAEFGESIYTVAEASLHWLAYILLGKLLPVMYVLERR